LLADACEQAQNVTASYPQNSPIRLKIAIRREHLGQVNGNNHDDTDMSEKPESWMEQSRGLFKMWKDQQEKIFGPMFDIAGYLGLAGGRMAAMTGDPAESLRQAQSLWQSSVEQWVCLTQKALPQSGITAESLKTLFDPGQWAQTGLGPLDATIEHLVEGPSYATLWTLDRKILKAQKLRGEWAKDLAAYQLLMHGAWNEAVKRFVRNINDTQGTPITSWRELTDVWVETANETLVETHRTPNFLEAQRRLTRSGAECRLQEREIAEAFCELQQTPTRTEMDEVQREVYELRRRLRTLERSLMPPAIRAAPSPNVATPRSRRPRRAPPKSTV
jgi:poly[(R)-3-hydroxyalkanoate] polymerase subunit PhaE